MYNILYNLLVRLGAGFILVLAGTHFNLQLASEPTIVPSASASKPALKIDKASQWMNTLNPDLNALSHKDKKNLLREAVRLAHSVVSHPEQLTQLRGYLNATSWTDSTKPRSSSPGVTSGAIIRKSDEEKLFDQRVLALAGQLVDKHQAGSLDVEHVRKDLGVKLKIKPFKPIHKNN